MSSLNKLKPKQALELIMTGQTSEQETGDFLKSLAKKGETIEDIVDMVKVMRVHMNKIELDKKLLDTCGTGGDGLSTINVSTAAAIVCAAAGVYVAKHGNKAASSQSGSADVLEALGVNINLNVEQVKKCIEEIGIGFMFAPLFHPAMKYVVPVRKKLGIRTIFNFLGPLSNPANAKYQVIGVSAPEIAPKLGQALIELGSEKIIIVNSEDGLDEVSVSAPTQVYEYTKNQETKQYKIKPDNIYKLEDVRGGDAKQNAQDIEDIFSGKLKGAKKEFVIVNAAMGLLAYQLTDNYENAKDIARQVIDNKKAQAKLQELIKASNEF